MEDILFKEHIINGLPVANLYAGTQLKFSRINYFFGSNGSGKTLTLKNVTSQAKNTLSRLGKTSQGYFAQYIGPSSQNNDFYRDSYQIMDNAFQHELNGELSPSVFYQHLSDHPEIMIRIRDSIQRFLGRHPNLAKRGINNVMTFFRENDTDMSPYSPTSESDGLRRLSLLLTYVYHPKCLILLVDEPELHLHPDMVSFLLQEIEDEVRFGKQFFFATHSPEIIKVGKEDKFAYFYFDLHDKLKESRIIDLNQAGAQSIMNELGFLLDVNRRAFLFAPVTLFVEGFVDEFVYSNIKSRRLVDWPRRIFMVNAGGCTNIPKFVELWHKLNKPFKVIIDNVNRSKPLEKDAVKKTIDSLCSLFSITSNTIEEKINLLESKNVFVASFSDVCEVTKKDNSQSIHVNHEDLEQSWDLFEFKEQINILKKALSLNEDGSVRIRDIEESWMRSIISEITSQIINSKDISTSLREIKKYLEENYPRLEVFLNPNEETYLSGKYAVSEFRNLYFEFSKDSAKHNFKAIKPKDKNV